MDRFTHDDVSSYRMGEEAVEALIADQDTCTFIWASKEGWPLGATMAYVWARGRFWLTATEGRARVGAVRNESRVSLVIARGGMSRERQSILFKSRATVHEDRETMEWFLPALVRGVTQRDSPPEMQAFTIEALDTDQRVVIEVEPLNHVAFDGSRKTMATENALRRSLGEAGSAEEGGRDATTPRPTVEQDAQP